MFTRADSNLPTPWPGVGGVRGGVPAVDWLAETPAQVGLGLVALRFQKAEVRPLYGPGRLGSSRLRYGGTAPWTATFGADCDRELGDIVRSWERTR